MPLLHSLLSAQHDPCQATSHGTTATNGEKNQFKSNRLRIALQPKDV